jgi:uncharacterized protein YjbI with pentapeptide repeats
MKVKVMNKGLFTLIFLVSIFSNLSFKLFPMEAGADPDAEVPRGMPDLIVYDVEAYNGILAGKRDMAGVNLVGARFPVGIDLAGIDLIGANLDQAFLLRANLQGAKGGGASFRGADLTRASCLDASFERAVFRDAKLENTVFRGALLMEADFNGNKYLIHTNFQKAKLNRAGLRGALLHQVSFVETDLRETDLRKALLENCEFIDPLMGDGTKCVGTNFYMTRFLNFRRLPMGADLTEAQLKECYFENVPFDGTLLCRSVIISAGFKGSPFKRVDLTEAHLEKVGMVDSPIQGRYVSETSKNSFCSFQIGNSAGAVAGAVASGIVSGGATIAVAGIGWGIGAIGSWCFFSGSSTNKDDSNSCKGLMTLSYVRDCSFSKEPIFLDEEICSHLKQRGVVFGDGASAGDIIARVGATLARGCVYGVGNAMFGPVGGAAAAGVAEGVGVAFKKGVS